jgi:hypothetical protein
VIVIRVTCQSSMSVPNPYRSLNYSSCSHHLATTQYTGLEGNVKVKENKLLTFHPNAYCLLDNIMFRNIK